MKKILGLIFCLMLISVLAACGAKEDATTNTETNNEESETTAIDAGKTDEVESIQIASTVDPRLQEPTADTVCEMCNMKVYEKDDEMGMFSAQAVKEDGSNSFYDDIGCLLNAELANNETNDKYVRDYNTLEWVLVEDATIVKTDLKTPMNWGYAFFKEEADAQKFIDEHDGYHIEELETVKQLAKERREAKMKKQAEQQGNQQGDGMQMQMQHGQN